MKNLLLLFALLLFIPACGSGGSGGEDNWAPELTATYYPGTNGDPDAAARIELSWTRNDRDEHYEIESRLKLIADNVKDTHYTIHGPFCPNDIYIYIIRPYREDVTGLGHIYGPMSNSVWIRIPDGDLSYCFM